jgi:hypothetical protein
MPHFLRTYNFSALGSSDTIDIYLAALAEHYTLSNIFRASKNQATFTIHNLLKDTSSAIVREALDKYYL